MGSIGGELESVGTIATSKTGRSHLVPLSSRVQTARCSWYAVNNGEAEMRLMLMKVEVAAMKCETSTPPLPRECGVRCGGIAAEVKLPMYLPSL